jgi:two-component system sensor histidine kinase MtrB
MPERRLGLRARGVIAFAVLALGLSCTLAVLTYGLTRSYLVRQRDTLAVRQALVNARAVRDALDDPRTDVRELLDALPNNNGSRSLLVRAGDRWYESSGALAHAQLPPSLVEATEAGHAARQRAHIAGQISEVVGVPLGAAGGSYFEVMPLIELQRTLRTLAWSLLAAATVTTVVGALFGWYASRRVLRPVRQFAGAAGEVARGRLDTRLEAHGDPDLSPVAESFNEMAEALQARIEQDERFVSDVTHELRTPLTAISAAIDVLDRRANESTRPVVDVLRSQIRHFERLVLDLLEISRLDAGATELATEPVDPRELVMTVLRRLDHADVSVSSDPSVPALVRLDKRRVERVITNLVENADQHGGGPVRVELAAVNGHGLQIAVEDAGPGIERTERSAIFSRFHRGQGPVGAHYERGNGLGLALVAEHCRVHGGRAWVEDREGGGARFVAELAEP